MCVQCTCSAILLNCKKMVNQFSQENLSFLFMIQLQACTTKTKTLQQILHLISNLDNCCNIENENVSIQTFFINILIDDNFDCKWKGNELICEDLQINCTTYFVCTCECCLNSRGKQCTMCTIYSSGLLENCLFCQLIEEKHIYGN